MTTTHPPTAPMLTDDTLTAISDLVAADAHVYLPSKIVADLLIGYRAYAAAVARRSPEGAEGVLAEIAAERARQDAQWGGASHDDEHGYQDWADYRAKFEDRMYEAVLASPFDGATWTATARDCLVKIAALAVAQIESLDRLTSPTREPTP